MPAELTIKNDSSSVAAAVRLQSSAGGPATIHPVTAAPGTQVTLTVNLPAISPQQMYHIDLLATYAPAVAGSIAHTTAAISWPVETVEQSRQKFFDPDACDKALATMPVWPDVTLRYTFLGLVLMCLGAGGVLFIRRPHLRLLCLALVIVAGFAVTAYPLAECNVVNRIDSRVDGIGYATMTTRRTVSTLADARDGRLVPVYMNERQLLADTGTVLLADGGAYLELKPNRPRVFLIAPP